MIFKRWIRETLGIVVCVADIVNFKRQVYQFNFHYLPNVVLFAFSRKTHALTEVSQQLKEKPCHQITPL